MVSDKRYNHKILPMMLNEVLMASNTEIKDDFEGARSKVADQVMKNHNEYVKRYLTPHPKAKKCRPKPTKPVKEDFDDEFDYLDQMDIWEKFVELRDDYHSVKAGNLTKTGLVVNTCIFFTKVLPKMKIAEIKAFSTTLAKKFDKISEMEIEGDCEEAINLGWITPTKKITKKGESSPKYEDLPAPITETTKNPSDPVVEGEKAPETPVEPSDPSIEEKDEL